MDAGHDIDEAVVDFFAAPTDAELVLGLFEAGDGDSAGVGGFGGAEEDVVGEEEVGGFGGAGHVGAFGDGDDAVFDHGGGVVFEEFVLGGAGEGDVSLDGPRCGIGVEGAVEFFSVFLDATAAVFLEVDEPVEFFAGDALRVVDEAG